MATNKKIETHGIKVVPVFGGVLEECDGVMVERCDGGRYYIGLGQPGFNSTANNRGGYKSAAAAARACRAYAVR